MATVTIKGRDYVVPVIRDSYTRRAQHIANQITTTLGRLGLTEDDIDLELESVPLKRAPATVTFWADHKHCVCSWSAQPKYIENLALVAAVLKAEIDALDREETTPEDFIAKFAEERDVEKARIEARKTLGVAEDEGDFAVIDKAYKKLAMSLHPDRDSGDAERFKQVNVAHKLLKRELA